MFSSYVDKLIAASPQQKRSVSDVMDNRHQFAIYFPHTCAGEGGALLRRHTSRACVSAARHSTTQHKYLPSHNTGHGVTDRRLTSV